MVYPEVFGLKYFIFINYFKKGECGMNVEKEVLVLGMSPYSFKNDDGELIEGLIVHYVAPDEPLEQGVGLKPIKARLDVKEYGKYQHEQFPALCTLKGNFQLSNMKINITDFSNFKPLFVNAGK